MATKAVSGLSVEGMAAGAWEVLPWSWLIDWFTNIGDFMLQNSNTIPASLAECCIMRKTVTVNRHIPFNLPAGVSGGEGVQTLTNLSRIVGVAFPQAHLPFISAGRLSILGSLFIQRFKG
jgi:hypothetical protein